MKINSGVNLVLFVVLLVAGVVSLRVAGVPSVSPATGKANVSPSPVLVELFTSEGCSSCPPADQVLSRLDQEREKDGLLIIPLSQHVDYWNQLGWRDPYSAAEFSERQRDYAEVFGRNGVYTPQMVVDGRWEFVGSYLTKAHDVISQAAQLPKATIKIESAAAASKSDVLEISLQIESVPTVARGDKAEVLLVIAEDDLSSSVASGENAGRKLKHTAVVRQLINLGNITESGAPIFKATPVVKLAGNWRHDKLRLVVFVQERNSRHVLGAAMIKLAA